MLTDVLGVLLYVYCGGVFAIAMRLAWHMSFELDHYDWLYNKSHIWLMFILSTLLWPIFFAMTPRHLIDPSRLFKKEFGSVTIDIAGRKRKLDQLRDNPPPCSSVIRYSQGSGGYKDTYGEFLFFADAVEANLAARIQDTPRLVNNDEGAILNWIRQRNNSQKEPTAVPDAWSRFQYVADDLIRHGSVEVKCLECGGDVSADDLVHNDDIGRPGWNFNRVLCPRGHNLLIVQVKHLLVPNRE